LLNKCRFGKIIFSIVLLLFISSSCSSKLEKNEKTIQFEARNCYLQGKTKINVDSIQSAEKYFQQALQINPFFAPAYEGLGLVAVEKGENDLAISLFRKSLSLDANWVPAEIGLLQVGINKGQYERVIDKGDKIISDLYVNQNNQMIQKLLIEDVQHWKKIAIKKRQTSLIYQLGNWESLKNLQEKEYITRTDFTIAFVDIFSPEIYKIPVNEFYKAEDISPDMTFYQQIEMVIKYDIIIPFPDGLFKPEHIMKRAEVALIINKFINKINIQKFKFDGISCTISDISVFSPIYRPINKVVKMGIMECLSGSKFNPDSTISGYELLQILFRLQNIIKKSS